MLYFVHTLRNNRKGVSMTSKFYDKVLGVRISKDQKDKLDAISKLSGEKSARLVRDCIECFIGNEKCLARVKYKKLQNRG